MDSILAPGPSCPELNHDSGVFSRKIVDVAKLINPRTLLRVRDDNAKSFIVDWIHPVLARGKLVMQNISSVIHPPLGS